jgi:phosphatidylserine decarboxylase
MSDFELTTRHLLSARMQHVYPKRALSKLMFSATRIRFAPWKNWQIRWFIERYQVNIEEALETNPREYPEFNTFFTRPLSDDARPLPMEPDVICSPADGRVLELGDVTDGRMLQVKGQELDVVSLLGGDKAIASPFINGKFVTVYLSPRDYHRVHMPVDGTLERMAYIPGKLFGVSLPCVHGIPELFTRNERVVSFFSTPAGPVAQILVGAVFVGCIETVWAGAVNGPRDCVSWSDYSQGGSPIALARGQEMGRFNMGSTVITVFGGDAAQLAQDVRGGDAITMGTPIGSWQ